jgi:hypothetical protein
MTICEIIEKETKISLSLLIVQYYNIESLPRTKGNTQRSGFAMQNICLDGDLGI